MKLLSLGDIGQVPDIDMVQLSKTAAKADVFLDDHGFDSLQGEKEGRIINYNAYDAVAKSEVNVSATTILPTSLVPPTLPGTSRSPEHGWCHGTSGGQDGRTNLKGREGSNFSG